MATDPNDPTTTDEENQPVGVDRVQFVSYQKDGTPDQTPNFEVIDTEEEESAPEEATPKRRGRKANVEEAAER